MSDLGPKPPPGPESREEIRKREREEEYEELSRVDAIKRVVDLMHKLYAEHRITIEIDPFMFLTNIDVCLTKMFEVMHSLHNQPELIREMSRLGMALMLGKSMSAATAYTAIGMGLMVMESHTDVTTSTAPPPTSRSSQTKALVMSRP